MSLALTKPMSLDEFLVWEERQDTRWEFDGFNPVAMTGGTRAHSAIQRNLITALTARLRGKPCQPFTSDLKVQTARSIRYPDAFVVCSPGANEDVVVTNPVVVFEILSPGTAGVDTVEKNAEYRDTPSIKRYVMLSQDHPHAVVFERIADDWVGHILSGDITIGMPEIDIVLPLLELYDGVVPEDTTATS
jgi:Uma2 family endonuclease